MISKPRISRLFVASVLIAVVGSGVGIGLVLLLGGGAARSAGTQTTTTSGPPPLISVHALAYAVDDQQSGMHLDPPPPGNPPMSAQDALAKMWPTEGAPGTPTGVIAVYALLTWGQNFKQAPVWELTYQGSCVLSHGPSSDESGCTLEDYNTFVDANTGSYIASVAESNNAISGSP
jgi:hypothetical protein